MIGTKHALKIVKMMYVRQPMFAMEILMTAYETGQNDQNMPDVGEQTHGKIFTTANCIGANKGSR